MAGIIIILTTILLLAWAAILVYRHQPDEVRRYFWLALATKIVAGLMVGVVYFYHYGLGDTITYWNDGCLVAQVIKDDPLRGLKFIAGDESNGVIFDSLTSNRPRSLFFIRIAGVLALISAGNYWIMSAILSFLSFLGSWFLFGKIIKTFPGAMGAAALSFLFLPSMVFWSSGLIKESLGLGSLLFLSGLFLAFYIKDRIRYYEWPMGLLCLWIGWNLKYYWFGIFIPVSVTTVMVVFLSRRIALTTQRTLLIWLLLFTAILLLVTRVHPNFYPERFVEVIWQSNREFMERSQANQVVHYYHLSPDLKSILINSPLALLTGIFRPFIWESYNFLSALAAIENVLLAVLVVTALGAWRNLYKSTHRLLILATVTYIILLAIFLALSTPNFGTLSRYKVGFLPFLVFLSLCRHPWLKRFEDKVLGPLSNHPNFEK